MSDPKLKEAMAEIMGVLKKHDVAGQVTLVSQSHSEFRVFLEPSWSALKMQSTEEGENIQIRVTKDDIPNLEERARKVEETLHILLQIRDLNGQNFVNFESLIKQIGEKVQFDHAAFSGYEPHREV